jgi:hypothetical protein
MHIEICECSFVISIPASDASFEDAPNPLPPLGIVNNRVSTIPAGHREFYEVWFRTNLIRCLNEHTTDQDPLVVSSNRSGIPAVEFFVPFETAIFCGGEDSREDCPLFFSELHECFVDGQL